MPATYDDCLCISLSMLHVGRVLRVRLWISDIYFSVAVETLAFSMRSLKSGEKIFTQKTKSKMRELK